MGKEQVSRAVVFGSAPCASWDFLSVYQEEASGLVVCADGGVNNARAAGFKPDLLVGDWDSGGAPEPGVACSTLPVEKDLSDLQAALSLTLSRGVKEFLLCGCTGGRLDHTASNLVLLEWIAARGGNAVIVDEDNEVRYLNSTHIILPNIPAFRYLSVIPLDQEIKGVYLQGVKYPLTDATLIRGDTFSISNEPSGPQAEILVGVGRVLLIRSIRL